jgi:manganese/zinc/iron transport system permease protein
MPAALHYVLMILVSVTAVGAFDAVGSILVVALMIGPPACAYLLTDRLSSMIAIGVGLGIFSAISGYWMANLMDASIAGCMATVVGLVFLVTVVLAPGRGLVAAARRRTRQRWGFAEKMLTIHLQQHEGLPEEARENRRAHLQEHLRWEPPFAGHVVQRAVEDGFVIEDRGLLHLTDAGRALASETVVDA